MSIVVATILEMVPDSVILQQKKALQDVLIVVLLYWKSSNVETARNS